MHFSLLSDYPKNNSIIQDQVLYEILYQKTKKTLDRTTTYTYLHFCERHRKSGFYLICFYCVILLSNFKASVSSSFKYIEITMINVLYFLQQSQINHISIVSKVLYILCILYQCLQQIAYRIKFCFWIILLVFLLLCIM